MELMHYGTPRHSGRYPWGSGKDPYQRASNFIGEAARLRKEGFTEVEIANYFDMSTTELRARQSSAKSYKRMQDIAEIRRLKEKGMSTNAIGERLGIPGSTVRTLLKPDADAKATKAEQTKNILAENIGKHTYIDYGKGVETIMGVSSTQLNTAVQMLKDEGYTTHELYIRQLGMKNGESTIAKVICPPGVTKSEVLAHIGDIRVPGVVVDANGIAKHALKTPTSISSKRISVRHGDEGGTAMDGVIELRRGVPELNLGPAHYAQVRIAVDGTHYLKGMAIYADDLPAGVDIRFNTNKTKKDAPHVKDTLKPMKEYGTDNNPFGAVVHQKMYKDKHGKNQLSALNIVQEEGDWDKWSRSLSSQFLSKQRASEAKKQLKKTQDKSQKELDEIMSLTNPVVKRKLLEAYASSCDSKAVTLKAAAYPRQAMQVILPINSMKKNEIYAPNFRDGEKVVLVRYPHGGTFEIPELTVNNKNATAKRIIGTKAKDAVGIHHSVAERLSGADFDGDTVLVIPNNSGKVKTSPALTGLKGFDPKVKYKYHEGMKVMSKGKQTQTQMGVISNLITDMTIKGASRDELARAVRHSMVVIDAAKHKLDYRQSELDNDIASLKAKYQGAKPGASTLISRSGKKVNAPARRLARASEGGHIDPKTGKLRYIIDNPNKKSKYANMSLVDDAHKLSSGYVIEEIYADHANRMKSLANKARKASLVQKDIPYSSEAHLKYAPQVESLRASINLAYRNKPLERQAQLLANSVVRQQKAAHPDMDYKAIKKAERIALRDARYSIGSDKYKIKITPLEWEAIQAGAITKNMLEELIENTSADHIKALATPKKPPRGLTPAQQRRALLLLENHTVSEVADSLGVSTPTIRSLLGGG